MIAGAAAVRFLLSSAGIATVMLLLSLWAIVRARSRQPRILLLVAAVFYIVVSIDAVPHAIGRWLARPFHPLALADVPPGRVAIVLLGSGSFTRTDWTGGRYSVLDTVGAERTVEAARVFALTNAVVVVSSGGEIDPEDPDDTAGATMRSALISLGVPADRVLAEERSKTTRDEAVIVAEMLRPLQLDHVVLVTSGIHMRRSLAVFRDVGIAAIPAISREDEHTTALWGAMPSRYALEESHLVVHELLGLAYYRLRGWQS